MGKSKIIRDKNFIISLIKHTMYNDITGLAAQLAYFFLLSLFPLLLFIVTLLPYLPINTDDILNVIRNFAPEQTLNMIESNLYDILNHRSTSLLSVGIIATLWSASKGMNAIVKALNRAYEVKETRSFIVARAMSVLLTLAMIFVFLIALVLPVFGKYVGYYLFAFFGISEQFSRVWTAIRWIISPLILFIVFVGIYYFAPNKKIKCLTVFPGAIIASIGWAIVSLGFSYYVSNFGHYSTTYGSLGGIIILMLWFYISGIILIIGGEINALLTAVDKDC
ncbi:YihY/virulence factor BrkB family protein [Heyndrickxia oleronia]|uniref:Ribonuclease n=1 Tax=Heyndrickxia oleronia TaxID=38875 RepID=A0A8E2ICF6_9BACI|nr:YihY/virulence factor BrkB family protein [Heyndrickxia oleronia]MEC1373481.1 YihY/virulence factor BrkB family protein [Heyndrickxia oleronia]OOP67381.1 ribonuclease [Heyndrickxia oleronia]QQZ04229.1 YihY/virulence factor BrkB family protein [Heyndrickxia oleronia]